MNTCNKTYIGDEVSLISSFPRSGSTWFANILNAHPDVLYRHEILGRRFDNVDAHLRRKIKSGEKLTADQNRELVLFLHAADIDTDRPPFFKKSYLKLSSDTLHHYAWLSAKFLPKLSGVYKWLYSPTDHFKLLLKETRSAHDLDMIVESVKPHHVFHLIRHPCAVVQSHLAGFKTGSMVTPTNESKTLWYRNSQTYAVPNIERLTLGEIHRLSDSDFIAFKWVQHVEFQLASIAAYKNSSLIQYEELVDYPLEITSRALNAMGLSISPSCSDFLNRSVHSTNQSFFKMDSSSEYFSVYRLATFKHDSWKEKLPLEVQNSVLDITEATLAKLDKYRATEKHES